MRDLKERNIITSWPMLKRKVERDGFPLGFMLGPNTRAWFEDEINAWLASRPIGGPTPRGIARANHARAAKKRAAEAQAEAQTEIRQNLKKEKALRRQAGRLQCMRGLRAPRDLTDKQIAGAQILRNGNARQGVLVMSAMTKGEREDLQRLVRQREKVLKSAAKQRSAELIADFENQMGQEYAFDQDDVWAQAIKSVKPLVDKAQAQIAARCRELGIPERFAPGLRLEWRARGYDNLIDKRKAELRGMAKTQIEAIERKAIVQIEMSCLHAQEQLALAGLTSEGAKQFIEALPSIDTLMPALSLAEIAGEAEPPIAEQLVSSNALRQRRYRERQALQRNGQASLQASPPANGGDGDGEVRS